MSLVIVVNDVVKGFHIVVEGGVWPSDRKGFLCPFLEVIPGALEDE